ESIDRLDKVTLAEVRSLYTEQLGAQDGDLAVVGDFDPAAVTQQFRELVGDWKAHVPYQRIERVAHPEVKGGTDNIDTPGKANAVYMAAETLKMRDTDPAYAALEIGDYILGGGPLSSRLADRVRQKEGLSYAIGSHFLAAARDPFAEVLVFAITNPKNINRLDQAIHQELGRLVEHGVTKAEVEEAIRSYLENVKVQRANDTGLVVLLAEELHNHRTMHYDEELENRIRKLTPEDVNAALRKYIDPKRFVIIRAGDFKK
ncbi:MAG TPA: insulinase family protein, partial [Gemmataceae bacterium]|nr:insulinase family protein [Gemmataceae bacterium]